MNVLPGLMIVSIFLALAMTGVVGRVLLRERRRSAARVAALQADIYRTEDGDIEILHEPSSSREYEAPPLFTPEFAAVTSRRHVPIAPLIAVAAAIAFGVVVGATRHRASASQPGQQNGSAAAQQTIELLALDHERAEDRLTVRGVVRNPAHGSEVEHLTAVVLVFNQQGGFLTSGRSPVESTDLEPGAEAKFMVTVPGAADVGKYRVSFRTDDRVIPHVDRRW